MQPAAGPAPIAVISDRLGLGDGIRLLPLIAWIGQRYPGHPIWWLAATSTLEVLRPNLDLLEGQVARFAMLPNGRGSAPAARRALRDMPRFHRVFDSRTRFSGVLAAWLLLRRERFYASLPFHLLTDRLPPRGRRRPSSLAERYWSLAEADAGEPMDWFPAFAARLTIPERARAIAEDAFPAGGRFVGIALTTFAMEGRSWPLENYLSLGRALLERGWTPVFFVGPNERRHLPALRAALPEALVNPPRYPDDPEDVFRIQLTAAAMGRMRFAIATDTGPGHLFGVLGVPLISLFGPTTPERAGAFARKLISVRGVDAAGRGSMAAVTVANVLEAVAAMEEYLAQEGGGPA